MDKIITYENLRQFAYSNDKICKKPIKGIVVDFFGLNTTNIYSDDIEWGIFYAEKGVIFINPYNNPWAWMNKQAVSYTDEVLDVIIKEYNLDDNIPLAYTGGSMGGQSALVYTTYSKRKPVICVTNCAVCDMVAHLNERYDLPRTMYSAFFNESGKLENVLKNYSPIHLADKMPKIRYALFHSKGDPAVNMQIHSLTLYNKLKNMNVDVRLYISDTQKHGDLTNEHWSIYKQEVLDAILEKTQSSK